MKKLIFAFLISLAAFPVLAQDWTLDTTFFTKEEGKRYLNLIYLDPMDTTGFIRFGKMLMSDTLFYHQDTLRMKSNIGRYQDDIIVHEDVIALLNKKIKIERKKIRYFRSK